MSGPNSKILSEKKQELINLFQQQFQAQRQLEDAQVAVATCQARIRDLMVFIEGCEVGQRIGIETVQANVMAAQEDAKAQSIKPGEPIQDMEVEEYT